MGQNYLEIFRTVSDSDMRAVYEDMVSADAAGDRPRALDTYAKELQKGCGLNLSDRQQIVPDSCSIRKQLQDITGH